MVEVCAEDDVGVAQIWITTWEDTDDIRCLRMLDDLYRRTCLCHHPLECPPICLRDLLRSCISQEEGGNIPCLTDCQSTWPRILLRGHLEGALGKTWIDHEDDTCSPSRLSRSPLLHHGEGEVPSHIGTLEVSEGDRTPDPRSLGGDLSIHLYDLCPDRVGHTLEGGVVDTVLEGRTPAGSDQVEPCRLWVECAPLQGEALLEPPSLTTGTEAIALELVFDVLGCDLELWARRIEYPHLITR